MVAVLSSEHSELFACVQKARARMLREGVIMELSVSMCLSNIYMSSSGRVKLLLPHADVLHMLEYGFVTQHATTSFACCTVAPCNMAG